MISINAAFATKQRQPTIECEGKPTGSRQGRRWARQYRWPTITIERNAAGGRQGRR